MSRNYFDRVVEGAIRLLEETGIKLESQRVGSFMAGAAEGCFTRGERICFNRDMILRFLSDIRQDHPSRDKALKETTLDHGESWCCLNLYDDAYGIKGKVPPVALSEYSPASRDLEATRVCLENSPVYGGPTHLPGKNEIEMYREMARITDRPMPILAMLINNPMKYDDTVLEFVLDHHAAEELSIEMVGGLPTIGNTTPMAHPAAHMQILAEDLAASLFTRAVTGRFEAPYLRGDPFDMKYANFVAGGPEYVLLDMASRRIYEHLTGTPREWGYLLSMSKKPGIQATYERTASCWLQALNGATWFKGSGQLSSDEVYSPEQVVIDRAIVKGVERLVCGLQNELSIDESLSIIREGLLEGHFLAQKHTVDRVRGLTAENNLFPATNLGQWRQAEEPAVLDAAGATVAAFSVRNDFSRSKEEIRELRRVCDHKRKEGFP
jgi:trimethylamine:corrinoid methyltransferase-like protein